MEDLKTKVRATTNKILRHKLQDTNSFLFVVTLLR